MLITERDPNISAKDKKLAINFFVKIPSCFSKLVQTFKPTSIANMVNGRAIKWACKSANRKVQKGNSVILNCGSIILLGPHQSNRVGFMR